MPGLIRPAVVLRILCFSSQNPRYMLIYFLCFLGQCFNRVQATLNALFALKSSRANGFCPTSVVLTPVGRLTGQ
ncbi:MAG TPA: hypothetical protein DCZ13_13090 [Porticoccaceae bacterium]|nr:hypothetical protein [Porticoccaceae bacterium]